MIRGDFKNRYPYINYDGIDFMGRERDNDEIEMIMLAHL